MPIQRSSLRTRRRRTTWRPKGNKMRRVIAVLETPAGATLDTLMAEGWQANSVRGVISCALRMRKRMALNFSSAIVESRGRVYRIVRGA